MLLCHVKKKKKNLFTSPPSLQSSQLMSPIVRLDKATTRSLVEHPTFCGRHLPLVVPIR